MFSLGAAQISLKAQACAIGRRVVFMGTGPLLYLVAYQYMKAGAAPVAVLDTTPFSTQIKGLPGMIARPLQAPQGHAARWGAVGRRGEDRAGYRAVRDYR